MFSLCGVFFQNIIPDAPCMVYLPTFVFLGDHFCRAHRTCERFFQDSGPTEVWADFRAGNFRCYEIAVIVLDSFWNMT